MALNWRALTVEYHLRCLAARPESLLEEAHHESPPLRFRIAWALGAIGPGAGAALHELVRLAEDEESPIRATAAWALGRLGAGGKAAVPSLLSLLTDPAEEVRNAAASALEAIDPELEFEFDWEAE
ncbi:MAG: HEAT repeat domain-containing protein [Planctomycetes bacterium]|nr:HEAT repeat domain-containing protein [Planctomycetota bacterium]